MHSGPTQERCAHSFLSSSLGLGRRRIRGFCHSRTRVYGHSGLAGSPNKHSPAQLGQAVPLFTSQGEAFHRHSPFLVSVSNQAFIRSDTGYMTTSGPCPIFEGLVPISLSFGWRADGDSFSIDVEILSKHGPFDIAMLPIWRGGTLSCIARLGFRVSLSSLRTNL